MKYRLVIQERWDREVLVEAENEEQAKIKGRAGDVEDVSFEYVETINSENWEVSRVAETKCG